MGHVTFVLIWFECNGTIITNIPNDQSKGYFVSWSVKEMR